MVGHNGADADDVAIGIAYREPGVAAQVRGANRCVDRHSHVGVRVADDDGEAAVHHQPRQGGGRRRGLLLLESRGNSMPADQSQVLPVEEVDHRAGCLGGPRGHGRHSVGGVLRQGARRQLQLGFGLPGGQVRFAGQAHCLIIAGTSVVRADSGGSHGRRRDEAALGSFVL